MPIGVRLRVNGLGAFVTGAALLIILLAKFVEGAWLTIVVIPLTLLPLGFTCHYYEGLERQLLSGTRQRLDLRAGHAPPLVVIPIERWDRISQTAMAYAMRLSRDVVALHCTDLDGPEAEEQKTHLRGEWTRYVERPAIEAGLPPLRLLVVPSPYRSVLAPLLRVIEDLRRDHAGRPVAVVLPQLVEARWWEVMLHTSRAPAEQGVAAPRRADLATVGVP